MPEVVLSAVQGNWRLFMTRKADSAFLGFVAKVFNRDSYCCQFCGFSASSHLEDSVVSSFCTADWNSRND